MAAKKHSWGTIEYPPKAQHKESTTGRKTGSEKTTSTERRAAEEHPQKKTETK